MYDGHAAESGGITKLFPPGVSGYICVLQAIHGNVASVVKGGEGVKGISSVTSPRRRPTVASGIFKGIVFGIRV